MQFSDSLEDTMAGGIVAALNNNLGTASELKFYDGTLPAATTDPDDGTLLVTLPMVATPFSWGDDPDRMICDISTAGATVIANGTVQYWRLKNDLGVTVMQGTAGSSGEEINFNNAAWTVGQFPFLTAWTIEITFTP